MVVVVVSRNHGIQLIVREAALEWYKQSGHYYTAVGVGKVSGVANGKHIVLAGSAPDRG